MDPFSITTGAAGFLSLGISPCAMVSPPTVVHTSLEMMTSCSSISTLGVYRRSWLLPKHVYNQGSQ